MTFIHATIYLSNLAAGQCLRLPPPRTVKTLKKCKPLVTTKATKFTPPERSNAHTATDSCHPKRDEVINAMWSSIQQNTPHVEKQIEPSRYGVSGSHRSAKGYLIGYRVAMLTRLVSQ